MNTLSTWIVSAVDDPAAPVVWLTVKFTVYLAVAWLVHATLRPLNPRWRVLLWRSGVAGFAILAAFFYLPPLMSFSLPSPPASEDRIVHKANMWVAVSLVANGPSVDRGAKTELAGEETAPSGQYAADGHRKSVISPNCADVSAYEVASYRFERTRAALTGFVLAARRSLYLSVALAIWCGGILLGVLRTMIGLGRLVRIRREPRKYRPGSSLRARKLPTDSASRALARFLGRAICSHPALSAFGGRRFCSHNSSARPIPARSCLRSSLTSSHIC